MRTDLYTYRVLIIAQKQLHFSFLYWTQAANIQTVRVEKCNPIYLLLQYYSLGKKGWGWDFRGRNAGAVTCSSFYPPVPSLLPFFFYYFCLYHHSCFSHLLSFLTICWYLCPSVLFLLLHDVSLLLFLFIYHFLFLFSILSGSSALQQYILHSSKLWATSNKSLIWSFKKINNFRQRIWPSSCTRPLLQIISHASLFPHPALSCSIFHLCETRVHLLFPACAVSDCSIKIYIFMYPLFNQVRPTEVKDPFYKRDFAT